MKTHIVKTWTSGMQYVRTYCGREYTKPTMGRLDDPRCITCERLSRRPE